MEVTPDTLSAIWTAFDMRFNQAFNRYEPQWRLVAMEIPSDTTETIFPMETLLPEMREWVGERQMQSGMVYEFSIRNKDFEATVEVHKNHIADNRIGLYNNQIDALGQAAAMWPDKIIFDLLMDGENVKCHDGQSYFDEDHPVNPADPSRGTQSNLFPDTDLTADNIEMIQGVAGGWQNENGDPFTVTFDTVLVPPQLRSKGRKALVAETLANGASNITAGTAKLVVVPRLAKKPKEWYMLDTTRPIKPLIWQLRQAPEFTALDNPTDANVFYRKKFIYGVDARGNAAFGLWFLAVKCICP